MTHHLFLGEPGYSSWSMRIWLLADRFDLPVRVTWCTFYQTPDLATQIGHAPARSVPFLLCDDGAEVRESIAIAEELAARHPAAAIWPKDPTLRALARSLAAEMHAGFTTLRTLCPMVLRTAYADVPVPPELAADLARIALIWEDALDRSGGPWLCGGYCAADAFFAPVAARIAGYGLPVPDRAAAYVARHLSDPGFRRFRALGQVTDVPWGPDRHETVYRRDHPRRPWPGPAPRPARACHDTPQNDACPYSGRAPTHMLVMDGRVWGFCNAICRDKTAADPEAWPAFMAMVAGRSEAAVNRS
ncbi:glutathione S-transferase [Palleronia rufa]|uniref:glutathione S-transferase n=1 Tax=Palleronia rufa TaxID=1530186 RepID=UPI000565ADB0|nr:glutathione S-transferase [Palleronia rufa]